MSYLVTLFRVGAISIGLFLILPMASALGSGLSLSLPDLNRGLDPKLFRLTVFAMGLNFPSSMQKDSDGNLIVATGDPRGASYFDAVGKLVLLSDKNGDGVADGPPTVVYEGELGAITSFRISGNLAVLVSRSYSKAPFQIHVLKKSTGSASYHREGGIDFQFPSNYFSPVSSLAVRTRSKGVTEVYFNIGSQNRDTKTPFQIPITGLFTESLEPDSLYRFLISEQSGSLHFSDMKLIARGVRNASGIAFHPRTGDLYFVDNGMTSTALPHAAVSADELNRIKKIWLGRRVFSFGFPDDYFQYITDKRIGKGGVVPLVRFQPLPDKTERRAPREIAFAPPKFPAAFRRGLFVSFHGSDWFSGTANPYNPLVFVDLPGSKYLDFMPAASPAIGHLDGLLATDDSIFGSDLTRTGSFSNAGTGVIYQLWARP